MSTRLRSHPLAGILLLFALVAAACSGGDDQAAPAIETIDLRDSGEDASGGAGDEIAPEPEVGASEPIEIDSEPVRRVDDTPTVDASNWIARTFMGSQSVELVWAPVEGADTYRLFRLPTAVADYDAIATGVIENADEIYDGLEFGFIDDDLPAGEFLTYVIVAEVGDETTEPRWTEALTVDDFTPPAPITDLVAEVTEEGVLLSWAPAPDNVEFGAYNVSILEDGQLRYIGGGADVGQVSFLDDEDFVGTRSYVVAAVDFHNNVSETAQVDVAR